MAIIVDSSLIVVAIAFVGMRFCNCNGPFIVTFVFLTKSKNHQKVCWCVYSLFLCVLFVYVVVVSVVAVHTERTESFGLFFLLIFVQELASRVFYFSSLTSAFNQSMT